MTDVRHGDQTADVLPSSGAYHPDPFLLEAGPPNPDDRPIAHIAHGRDGLPPSRPSGATTGVPAGNEAVSRNRRRRRRRDVASHLFHRTTSTHIHNTDSKSLEVVRMSDNTFY